MKRATIWCSVTCLKCGDSIGLEYKNAKTISKLKRLTKDWKHIGGTWEEVCPDCYEKLKRENGGGI